MYTSVLSATIHGLEAVLVRVEVDVSSGLPGFSMVGSLSSQVRESQDRVRTALHNAKIAVPPSKITVNLSPADIPKGGTGFDLPIAAAILEILGGLPRGALQNILVAGEIGLDGKIRSVRGILAMAAKARESGCRACIVPAENRKEAGLIKGLAVAGVSDLREFMDVVKEERWSVEETDFKDGVPESGAEDFSDIRGQESGKRAALLAAAGFHNLLLIGPPGSGKTMLARRISELLPDLSYEESLELAAIYSVAGMLPQNQPWISRRPFRSPHHTISPQALAGGGRIPRPGEITLAHRGVLFLDELPEMQRVSLELLRQPLEERKIWISRVEGRYCFPANFLLVAAMNPCPCGYYPDRNRCNCSSWEVNRYLNRISQPLLDRIDLCVTMTSPTYGELRKKEMDTKWTRDQMRKSVNQAQELQRSRYKEEPFFFNSEIPAEKLDRYCVTEPKAELLLQKAFSSLGLTARGCGRILKVARTAADLAGSEIIREEHMAEAVGYRSLDRQYWKIGPGGERI